MCKKIMVAIDGSDAAWKALDFASALGRKAGSDMVIVNVVDDVSKSNILELSFAGQELYSDLVKEMRKVSEGLLENAKEKLGDYPNKVKTISLFGNPVRQMMEAVKDEGIESIFVGTRGAGQFSEMIVGSTTNKVLQSSPVPVVVVK